jgi:hypothetical protein
VSLKVGRSKKVAEMPQPAEIVPREPAGIIESAATETGITLDEAIISYLKEVRCFRSPKTITAAVDMLQLFGAGFSGRFILSICRADLLEHMTALKARRMCDRTIYNHIMRIGTLLKANGVKALLSANDKPQYEEKGVEAYDEDQLATLFSGRKQRRAYAL